MGRKLELQTTSLFGDPNNPSILWYKKFIGKEVYTSGGKGRKRRMQWRDKYVWRSVHVRNVILCN